MVTQQVRTSWESPARAVFLHVTSSTWASNANEDLPSKSRRQRQAGHGPFLKGQSPSVSFKGDVLAGLL